MKSADDVDFFESDARRFGYPYQLAFYRALLAAVIGVSLPVYLVGVEKREPYRCGVWRVGEGLLGLAQSENEQAIERLKVCRERDTWPSGFERILDLDWI